MSNEREETFHFVKCVCVFFDSLNKAPFMWCLPIKSMIASNSVECAICKENHKIMRITLQKFSAKNHVMS